MTTQTIPDDYLFGRGDNAAERRRLEEQAQLFLRATRQRAQDWVREPASVRRWLDLGCGEGHLTDILRRRFSPALQMFGVDRDEIALAAGRRIYPQILFEKVDLAGPWPHWEPGFDAITASLFMLHMRDLRHVIRSVFQNLVPGGLFWVHDMRAGWPTTWPANEPYTTLAHNTAAVLDSIGGHPNISEILPALMREVGFVDIEADPSEEYPLGVAGGGNGRTASDVMLGVFHNAQPAITARLGIPETTVLATHRAAFDLARNPTTPVGLMPMINIRGYKRAA